MRSRIGQGSTERRKPQSAAETPIQGFFCSMVPKRSGFKPKRIQQGPKTINQTKSRPNTLRAVPAKHERWKPTPQFPGGVAAAAVASFGVLK